MHTITKKKTSYHLGVGRFIIQVTRSILRRSSVAPDQMRPTEGGGVSHNTNRRLNFSDTPYLPLAYAVRKTYGEDIGSEVHRSSMSEASKARTLQAQNPDYGDGSLANHANKMPTEKRSQLSCGCVVYQQAYHTIGDCSRSRWSRWPSTIERR